MKFEKNVDCFIKYYDSPKYSKALDTRTLQIQEDFKKELNLYGFPDLKTQLWIKGGGMYLIFPVIVLVKVLLQCLSCNFGQN